MTNLFFPREPLAVPSANANFEISRLWMAYKAFFLYLFKASRTGMFFIPWLLLLFLGFSSSIISLLSLLIAAFSRRLFGECPLPILAPRHRPQMKVFFWKNACLNNLVLSYSSHQTALLFRCSFIIALFNFLPYSFLYFFPLFLSLSLRTYSCRRSFWRCCCCERRSSGRGEEGISGRGREWCWGGVHSTAAQVRILRSLKAIFSHFMDVARTCFFRDLFFVELMHLNENINRLWCYI